MNRIYRGAKRQEISFPLGGIGTGSIGLDGTGRLRDWDIYNHPSKGSVNGFTHFGIRAETADGKVDARVMNSDLLGSCMGRYVDDNGYWGYGYGPVRYLLCGVPHFRDCEFGGEFPLAELRFIDETFPGQVKLEAFNPFIPSDDADSSIPAAFFTAEVKNDTDKPLTYTFELSVNNPSKHTHINRAVRGRSFTGIELADDFTDDKDFHYGSLILAVPAEDDAQKQQYWYRGGWFDSLEVFWHDFTAPGRFRNRVYDAQPGTEDMATLAVSRTVAPGETYRQRFLLGWFYPNCMNYWQPCNSADSAQRSTETWKNYYAKLFRDISAVAEYSLGEWDRLESLTKLFHDALFSSALPPEALEAVSANISVLKTATTLRLPDGQFYGFEGQQGNVGCCEGSCTHVYNYAFALPFLFPNLERSMRELDYTYNQREDGGMPFRLQLPLGSGRSNFRSCVDGLMGGIIKTYREWKISGDTEWLRRWWPKVKKSLEFAWAPTNADRWDPDMTGVITGRQHHTLDMELFGANAWLENFYLGALRTASVMAEAAGDAEASAKYRKMYENGRAYTDSELFNGEYYAQKVDIRDPHILDPYENGSTLSGGSTRATYWSDEAGQLKYQVAGGCMEDQVLAQWMCELSGVGEILDPAHVSAALRSIYKNNFKPSLRDHFNPCRIFGLNDEAGMVICDWPEGSEKPLVPIPYAEEVMHGFEYQAASHMILHGMEKEGMDVVRGIRSRYDGERRNPWNEFECGSNYARSMASYALLLAFSGFRFDMTKGRMGMLPRHPGCYFWAMDGAWGTCDVNGEGVSLDVLYGKIQLKQWIVPGVEKVKKVSVNGSPVTFSAAEGMLDIGEVTLAQGDKLSAAF